MQIQNGARALTGSACLNKPEIAFRDALQATFGPLDWLPIPDGTIHRFDVPGDKTGSANGWYLLFADGIASGCFGSWKAGCTHTWSSREAANPIEAEQLRQRIERAKEQREADRTRRQVATARFACTPWQSSRVPRRLECCLICPNRAKQPGRNCRRSFASSADSADGEAAHAASFPARNVRRPRETSPEGLKQTNPS